MNPKVLFAATALTGVVVSIGSALAADAGTTPRNWGGLWIGFGAGYAGSGNTASGGPTDVCLTSSSAQAGGRANTPVCALDSDSVAAVTNVGAQTSGGLAGAGSADVALVPDAQSVSTGYATTVDAGGTETAAAAGVGQAIPPSQTRATSSGSVGNGVQSAGASGFADGTSAISNSGSATSGTGAPVNGYASVHGISFTDSRTGTYGAASATQASFGGASAQALAIGLGGMQQFQNFSDTGGDFTPEIHIRYDHQTESSFVIGAELDLSMAGGGSASEKQVINPFDVQRNGLDVITLSHGFQSDVTALATARLRLGYAVGDYMVYGTGGLAYANYEATSSTTGEFGGLRASTSQSMNGNAFGGVVGGGVSTFVADNATVSLEGLYYKFNDQLNFDDSSEMSVGLDDAFSVMMKFSIRAN